MEGEDHWRNQSRATRPPYDREPWAADLVLDAERRRFVWTNTSHFVGGFNNHSRSVIDSARGFVANFRQRSYTPLPNRTIDSQRGVLYRLPHYVLQTAADNAAGLRWLGRTRLASGVEVDAIATSTAGGQLTLGIDPRTKELRATLGVVADPIAGDAAVEAEFTEYSRAGGLVVPGRRVNRVAGEVLQDVRYSAWTLDASVADSLLAAPAGFTQVDFRPVGEPVRELAPGVWMVGDGGYWSLVVAFSDHVAVVEAPRGATADVIRRASQLAPGKPIRYVIPTHHHDDHAGGMRAYMGIDATVVTTPGNREYFERMAGAHSTLLPDSLSRHPRPARVEVISGKRRVLTDGSRTLELHDIGPSPHVNEMLVAWIPEAGILFQGDLLNLPPDGTIPPSAANLTTRHFAEWLRQRNWDVKALAGVHMAPGTMETLERALADAR
jgi:glyoxylase-like metal-dependent hydrolase (beta-lactamase superfamily II)